MRTSDGFGSPGRKAGKRKHAEREPYIKLNDTRYTWSDVVDMEDDELGRMLTDLDGAAESIEGTLDSLQGDHKVRAQDKMRYCRKWATRIREEILELTLEDECRCDELEEQVRTYADALNALTDSVKRHLSPELAEIVLDQAIVVK